MAAHDHSPAARLAVVVAGQVLALLALLAAAALPPFADAPWSRDLVRWFEGAPPLDALAVAAHRCALVAAAWMLGATLLHLAAALARLPGLTRATARATVPAVRRAVAAVVLTAGIAAPGAARAAAQERDPTAGRVRDGRAVATASAPAARPAPLPGESTASPPVSSPAPPPAPSPAPPPAPRTVVVQAGDSLWSIAAVVVAAEQGRPVAETSESDVAARWAAIRAANASHLRSGDESLIYPGEEIVVPE